MSKRPRAAPFTENSALVDCVRTFLRQHAPAGYRRARMRMLKLSFRLERHRSEHATTTTTTTNPPPPHMLFSDPWLVLRSAIRDGLPWFDPDPPPGPPSSEFRCLGLPCM